jgi:ATP-dependent helicase/DNAse subunit B
VPLSLLVGPANAGKIDRLLDRYLSELERDPILIVPTAGDIERAERDLLKRSPALTGGAIGTFDDLLTRMVAGGDGRAQITDAQRRLLLRSLIGKTELGGLAGSARFAGFVDVLADGISELELALAEPRQVGGELGLLYAAYRAELDRLGLSDGELERSLASGRLAGELAAWRDERPVFVYGFEDFTGAQWRALEALAARGEVVVSLAYEPARLAFAALAQTQEVLARTARGGIEELPPRSAEYAHAALAHLERNLFDSEQGQGPALEGAIRFLEAAGIRAALELVADEILTLLGRGIAAEEIGIICPSLEKIRVPLETAFSGYGVPYVLEGRARLPQTPFGRALLGLLRFAWTGGDRSDLFAFIRSTYSTLTRSSADFLEGRLRGRAIHTSDRIEVEMAALRGGESLIELEALRSAASPLEAIGALARSMLARAYGLEAPPVSGQARLDLRAYESVRSLVAELAGWKELSGDEPSYEELLAGLERTQVRLGSAGEPGRVAVSDLLQARARRFRVVFVLGLEEGSLPRRAMRVPLIDEGLRKELEERAGLPARAEEIARERHLFYAACTRAYERLYLVREAVSEEGSPRQASPFWDEVQSLFDTDDVAHWTRRRSLSALVWSLSEAPTERERLRAAASLAIVDRARAQALARVNGWERQLARAGEAFERSPALVNPAVLSELAAKTTFSVTELEAFGGCSSVWLVERVVSPRKIDGRVDPLLRGSIAHHALYRFFSGLPKELGTERVEQETLERALAFLRECLTNAIASQARLELSELERRELEEGLWRDLEHFVRSEARSPLPLVPRRFELSFGSERSSPELRRGLDLGELTVSGKIDRVDLDPFSARGLVQDYKSGKTAHSAAQIASELKLQIPLYILVLRDLVGVEPLGGVYRALAGKRAARGLLRAEAEDDGIPGFTKGDYLDEEAFWEQISSAAEHAREFARRIRTGDVRHDPRGGECPSWCELWPICRVPRT